MIMLRPDLSGYKPPKFAPGDLVSHVRYHYRGVVVAHDPKCMADENWYQSNQTQPDRNQPWYHVLIDNSDTTTYVAEENLEPALAKDPIDHPLLTQFFSSYFQGQYYTHTLN